MPELIKIMISSKCEDIVPDPISGRELSEIRKELKEDIESSTLLGKYIFRVWINEDEPAQPANKSAEEVCLEAVDDCDILISIYNGHAGWATEAGDVGICHAELMRAINKAGGKVRLINIGDIALAKNDAEKSRNEQFSKYIANIRPFWGGKVNNVEDIKQRVIDAVYDAVLSLTHLGVNETGLGKFHSGEPLEWSRMNYKARHDEMCKVVVDAIAKRRNSRSVGDNLYVTLDGKEVLFVVNAIPDSISVPQAKEMVGQPFLHDFEYHDKLTDIQGGPVHIIACHKGATETQAKKLLGFPDATVVNPPFGIYVADNVQKVQFVFIRDCRDESTTHHGVQLFFEWLAQNGEDRLLAKRALARARIAKLIAEVNGL